MIDVGCRIPLKNYYFIDGSSLILALHLLSVRKRTVEFTESHRTRTKDFRNVLILE